MASERRERGPRLLFAPWPPDEISAASRVRLDLRSHDQEAAVARAVRSACVLASRVDHERLLARDPGSRTPLD